ncbi:MAG: sugar transferase [Spirulinaceae cyanobacterium RM2_2_10]|nr:sugar transferase [Spirulinaceae cyanobacterium RM2_2_10]
MTYESQWTASKGLHGWKIPLPTRRHHKHWLARQLNSPHSQRLFDIIFALLVLSLCAPLYALLAAIVALTSAGPIFYVQERVGKDFRHFGCIKFRTMVNNADQQLAALVNSSPQLRAEFEADFKLRRDPRVTPIGRFLRYTSLDEFPQFWNVLKGDMSVVGPRPLVPEELPRYGRTMAKVLTVKPGITGLWQVSGRNDIPYRQRVQIDAYYASYRTWWLDGLIVLKTIAVMLFPRQSGGY